MTHLTTKYIKPSFFENKVMPLLSHIYDDSMYQATYDFYHIKDILNQFSNSQLQSKEWLVNELKPFLHSDQRILIIGGWYGLMSHMLAETGIPEKIDDFELDKLCVYLHTKLKCHNNVSIHHLDGLTIFDDKKFNKKNRVLICTACEHIDSEDLESSLSMKHPGMIVALQSNNMHDIDSHINCHDSIDHFISTLPKMEILYQGTLKIDKYERYMVIAK